MATYKVPQDVEADDKLLGPFTFRQFIYLIIVAMAIAIAWGLSRLFVGLAIIPLPIILFFGALALPLRKDQPMEIYLAAIVSFYLKPRQRLWDPDGVDSLIEITAPKTVDIQRTKDLSQSEAEQRLSYLANIVDSQGWAIRGVSGAVGSMNTDVYLEAQGAEDILDTNTSVAHNFNQMMIQSTERLHEEARQRMMQATTAPTTGPVTTPALPAAPTQTPQAEPTPHYDPYPNFHQAVIQPLGDSAHNAEVSYFAQQAAPVEVNPPTTSSSPPTTDIIELANNPDLSIETIAHEADRLKKKHEQAESDEVVISLR